jgi:hypothetical protein
MNVIRDASNAITVAISTSRNRSKVGVERRPHSIIKNGSAILRAEDHMHENKRKRLSHWAEYRPGFQPSSMRQLETWGLAPCRYRTAPSALLLAAGIFVALATITANAQQLHIRIFNAKTNKPVIDEKLNVALRSDQIGSVAMATDKNGLIAVDTSKATIIRILANFYGDCRPRGELYTDYSIATILKTGISTGNICSNIALPPKPGELLLFEIPKTYIPTFPKPPATNLPHSDAPPTAY